MEITKEDVPVCIDIIRMAKKQDFGDINLSLEIYKGKIVNITSSSFRVRKFRDGENAIATAEIISMIKNIYKNKQSGNVTFSLGYKDGHIKQLTTQYLDKKGYQVIEKSSTA